MKLVVLGLSLSSSWGNGHATTYRSLLSAFAARGHEILFLERDTPWYRANRDLQEPGFCSLAFYDELADLARWQAEIAAADAVVVGSFVPEGDVVGTFVQSIASGACAFYDIDTPVTMANLSRGCCEYLSASQIPRYDAYLSFTGGPLLRLIEQKMGSPRAEALYCTADPEQLYPLDVPKRWDLSYLGTYSPDRQPRLETLLIDVARQLPERRFAVAGAQFPDEVIWPENVERFEHLPPDAHNEFYNASRFTLNLTRDAMIAAGWSPSVRLFEAAACGVPVISDRWDGIADFFLPGVEIALAERGSDVITALETEASPMGQLARRAMLAGHTPARRAEQLERILRSVTASPRFSISRKAVSS